MNVWLLLLIVLLAVLLWQHIPAQARLRAAMIAWLEARSPGKWTLFFLSRGSLPFFSTGMILSCFFPDIRLPVAVCIFLLIPLVPFYALWDSFCMAAYELIQRRKRAARAAALKEEVPEDPPPPL